MTEQLGPKEDGEVTVGKQETTFILVQLWPLRSHLLPCLDFHCVEITLSEASRGDGSAHCQWDETILNINASSEKASLDGQGPVHHIQTRLTKMRIIYYLLCFWTKLTNAELSN